LIAFGIEAALLERSFARFFRKGLYSQATIFSITLRSLSGCYSLSERRVIKDHK